MKQEISVMKVEMKNLERRSDYVEKSKRRNNIIIKGAQTENGNMIKEVVKLIKEKMEIEVKAGPPRP